jgi:peptidoglycan/LPS O-acetylase OafA/YrhL
VAVLQKEIDGAPAASVKTAAHPALPRLHELDGLRGVLALLVVCYHLSGTLFGLRAELGYWTPVLLEGWYAVDVFFMMSGFVMLLVYGKVFQAGVGARALADFCRARVARLYPVHLFAMLVIVAGVLPFILRAPELAAPDGRYSWRAAAASLLMLHSPWIDHRTWNYPAWSISAEWHAYVVFPFLVPMALRLKKAPALALVALAVSIACGIYLQQLAPDQYPSNGLVVLLRVLALFVGGMALQRLWVGGVVVPTAVGLAATAGTLALLCSPALAPYAVLLVPVVILTVLQKNIVQRVMRSGPLLWLGKVSYSLYMTHAIVDIFYLVSVGKVATRLWGGAVLASTAYQLGLWLSAIAVALVLGWGTWRFLELPGRAWAMRLMTGRKAA